VTTAATPAAVVLLSGGMDSATVLALAREQGFRTYALSLDYGQRHRAELQAARHVATALGAAQHEVVALDLSRFGGSALTDHTLAADTLRWVLCGNGQAPGAPW